MVIRILILIVLLALFILCCWIGSKSVDMMWDGCQELGKALNKNEEKVPQELNIGVWLFVIIFSATFFWIF